MFYDNIYNFGRRFLAPSILIYLSTDISTCPQQVLQVRMMDSGVCAWSYVARSCLCQKHICFM